MNEHRLDLCGNMGHPGGVAWRVVCTCGWETWDNPSAGSARHEWDDHMARVEDDFRIQRETAEDVPRFPYPITAPEWER